MRKRLWIWISTVLALFAFVVLLVEVQSERNYKKAILSSRLEGYSDIVAKANDYESLRTLLPENIRVTVVNKDGSVVYDTDENADSLDNHLSRPEIEKSLKSGNGWGIRKSETLNKEFFYYAHCYGDRIVRTALPFEIDEKAFFHPDWIVLMAVILAFAAALLLVLLISNRFGKEANKITYEKLQTQKHQMTNNIAHELRTPVTSIRGYLETIINSPEMDQEHRDLFTQRAYQQTLRLTDLIRDISLVTKIEEAPEMLEKEDIDAGRIVSEVLEEFSAQTGGHGMVVENRVEKGIQVHGNAILVYSIFRNLIENSVRYAGDGVTIHIEAMYPGNGKTSFLYYDTGRGVLPEHLGRIFERFYRVTPSDLKITDGSGLGLSIVRNAVAFHGGTVTAREHKPHGLEIAFSLPAGTADQL